jgi:D-alanyl-D-alanine carboxypeptidase
MGGSSGQARDARMRSLIEQHISEASTRRTVSTVAEVPEESPVWQPKIRLARTNSQQHAAGTQADGRVNARMVTTTPVQRAGSAEPIQPIPVKTISFKPATVRPAVALPVSVAQQASMPVQAPSVAQQSTSTESRRAVPMPGQAARVQGGQEEQAEAIAGPPPPARAGLLGTLTYHVPGYGAAEHGTVVALPAAADDAASTPASRPANARGGYMIQLGAFADESEAKARLRTAQSMAQDLLGNADPFTERVVKGSREFYRARFAGLDKDAAEAACQYFHKNDIACMALRSN